MDGDELIREAASRLRQVAADATPGLWQADGPWWHYSRTGEPIPTSLVSAGDDERDPVLLVPPGRGDADVGYAVAMQPAVAVALADLLELPALAPSLPYPVVAKALAVARAVLGKDQRS